VAQGAQALLADMLLLFIPPLMALVNHPELLGGLGARLSVAVVAGTLFVMGGVGLVVHRFIALEDQWRQGATKDSGAST
jgi:holin-like protein